MATSQRENTFMFTDAQKCTYHYDLTSPGVAATVNRVSNGIAHATTDKCNQVGPLTITFDATTGKGMGMYRGAYLVPQGQSLASHVLQHRNTSSLM